MKPKHSGFGRCVHVITFSILCLLVYSSSIGIAFGQKKPGSLNQGTTSDDKKLCKVKNNTNDKQWNNDDSEFCGLYTTYSGYKDSDPVKAKKARNEMIDLVEWQIEIYYKMRKDDRRKTVAILQQIFDILEIGTAAATGIINGTLRAKSVLAQGLSGFQAGRNSANKNFDILQTQVLINKMRSNRADISADIERKKPLEIDEYSWYAAKGDLTRLLNAGTFSDALDTLVKDSGNQAADAEKALADLKRKERIEGPPSEAAERIATSGDVLLSALSKSYKDAKDTAKPDVVTEKQKEILEKYQKIYKAITENAELFAEFKKIPDDVRLSPGFSEKLRGIINRLKDDPTQASAADYVSILSKLNIAVAEDVKLGPAFVKILEENK